MRRAAPLAALLFLAGCVGSEAAPSSLSTAPSTPEDATRIEGTVTNQELAPLENAIVQVDKQIPVQTDKAGQFRIPTTPGSHLVTVQALGYVAIGRTVTAVPDEATRADFTLEAAAIQVPYNETKIHDGYDICSYAIVTNIGTLNPCPLGTPKNAVDFDLADSWQYFVLELVWDTTNSFWVSINTPGQGCLNTAPCPGVEISRSPLRIDGAPMNEAIAKRWALDGQKMYANGSQKLRASNNYAGELRHEMNQTLYDQCGIVWGNFGVAKRLGCPIGVGLSTGIRFREYITVFHWEAPTAPMSFSALPKD